MNLFERIGEATNSLATLYHLNVGWFLFIYLISFVPFYFGYFLILYGTTRQLSFDDILHLRLRHSFHWTNKATWGLIIHVFGRIMPYMFIIIFGRNLPTWIYAAAFFALGFSIYLLYKRLLALQMKSMVARELSIEKLAVVADDADVERLWGIYGGTFEEVNKKSPCKQSFDHKHFVEAMRESTILKYLLMHPKEGAIGLAMITNDFKNTTWISSDYFREHFPHQFSKQAIYYFMGIALDKKHRGNRYSLVLIEHIIDDIPHHAVMGFDHSHNVNPVLHYFTRVVKQAKSIRRTHIDRQHYHIVERV